jgi:hypothetical protein
MRVLFCAISLLFFQSASAEKINMPLNLAKELSDYGLCSFDIHQKVFDCILEGDDGYWKNVHIYPEFISGEMPFSDTPSGIIAYASITGEIKKCTKEVIICKNINNFDELIVFALSKDEKDSSAKKLAILQVASHLYTVDVLIDKLKFYGINLNINSYTLINDKKKSILEISRSINSSIDEDIFIRMPFLHIIYNYLRGRVGYNSIYESVMNGNLILGEKKYLEGVKSLEIMSMESGHMKNAEIANNMSQHLYEQIGLLAKKNGVQND